VYYPLLGGGILNDIVSAIVNIGKFFMVVFQFIAWIGKLIAWIFMLIPWLVTSFNPITILSDFKTTIILITNSIVLAPVQIIFNTVKSVCNKFFSGVIGTFWGWDTKLETGDDYSSNYYRKNLKNRKCYVKDENVPFSVILGTIFCPPIGVFMELGITGWFHILVTFILMLAYYIPGLLYALMIIYN
jgi:uncharacterized membrane protein YqaE (UPF0057 family)